MQVPYRCLVILSGLLLFNYASAGDLPINPAKICKDTPNDTRCVSFFGATAGFKSLSGNVGGTQSLATNRNITRYTIFLHSGGGSRELAEKVSKALQAQGYSVRGIDDDQEAAAGASVDYFSDQDKPGAADVAEIANKNLASGATLLKPRLQNTTNPSGYLGVWLSGQ